MPFIPLTASTVQDAPDTRRGFIPLETAANDAALNEAQPEMPGRASVLRNVLLNNPLTALGETALNLGTMGVAMPVAGLAGLATVAGRAVGLTDRQPADVVGQVADTFTYRPRGELGQSATEIATYPFEKLAEAGHVVGSKVQDVTGSAVLATVADTAVNALPMMISPGVKGAKRILSKDGREPVAGNPSKTVADNEAPKRVEPTFEEQTGVILSDASAQGVARQGFTPIKADTPALATVQHADLAPHIAAGAEEIASVKASGAPIGEAFQKAGVHGETFSPESAQLAQFLADNAGDPKRLAQFDAALKEALTRPDEEVGTTRRNEPYGNDAENTQRPNFGEDQNLAGQSGFKPEDAPGGGSGHQVDGFTAAAPDQGRASTSSSKITYTLIDASELRPSHDVNLRARETHPAELTRPDWTRADAEKRVQGIVQEFDPARLAESMDDSKGAPIMALDGTVEAGNARAIAIQRVYQANGAKAEQYRSYLRQNAERLGIDPLEVDAIKRPVLVRVPDEPMPSPVASIRDGAEMPPDGKVNSWAPGANYVGFINDAPRPGFRPVEPVAPDAVPVKGTTRAEPIRREDVLIPFMKALGSGIYEGRVSAKGVMGFFRPKLEEVRIKRHADLETAAHELAHLIDHRVPEIRKSWLAGKDMKIHQQELRGLSYDNKKIYEGFAEFVRHYMTQPDVAKAKAPHFYQWFDEFTKRHEYGPAIRKAQDGMTGWFTQDAVDRARSKIGDHRPMTDALDGKWDAFRQATVDDLHGVYRMERELRGGKIEPNGPYESARLSRASASIADGAIKFGAPVLKEDGSYGWKGKGLEEILRPIEHLDDALLYFVGRSARELMAQKREHLFTAGEIDGMLKLRRPEYDKAFAEYQAWNKGVMDFAEAHGVINPQSRAAWQRMEYLPFHRVGGPEGFKAKPGDWSGIKALTGGTENIKDVLGNMTANAAMLIDKAVKNEARAKIAQMASEDGGGKFMVKIPAESRPVKIAKSAVIDSILKTMGLDNAAEKSPAAAAKAQKLRRMLEDAPAMLDLMQQNMPPAGGNVVAILKEGKPVWHEVNDPILLRALEAIDRKPPPWVVKWLGLPKRIGQAAITLTPDFMVANIARDTIMGSVMSRSGFRPIVDSLTGMRLRLKSDPLYKEFIANGGGLSSMFLDEHKFKAKLSKFYESQGIDYRTVLNSPDKLLGFIETMADAFETSTRLGEYKRAIDAGENPRHAAYQGREVSTDFAMRGDSKALGFMYDTVMFLRPALVSWDRLYRGLAHDPNKGAIATKAGIMATMSAALYLLNRDEQRYQDLPDWDRDTHWHFFVGDKHFRYPKIWEIGALSSAAERSAEKIMDADPAGLGKDFARILRNTFSLNLMPQIIAPLYEQAANRNSFTKAPIETPGMENTQPFMRAKPTTSETMKAVGMASRDLPESMQVNPVRAEALMRGYFNTWALYGLALSDKAFFSDKGPAMRVDQMPVVRRFYSEEPPLNTKYETQFYDMLGEAKRLHGTLRELDKVGRPEVADEKEKEPMATEAKPMERAAQNLQSINQEMRKVRRADDLTPQGKRQRLDALTVERNDLLKRAVLDTKASLKAKAE